MKQIVFFCLACLGIGSVYAQSKPEMDGVVSKISTTTEGESTDKGITLAAYVPPQIENMPPAASSMLTNKLNQIATQGGMGGERLNERFIITANIVVLTKDITPTAPPMIALTLEVTFYIGDGTAGTKFATTSVTVKGVGENETKAYISAIRGINVNNPDLQSFLQSGKQKIVQYYNSGCDAIIGSAQLSAKEGRFEEALFKLAGIPPVCKSCFIKSSAIVGPIYKKHADKSCQELLMKAKSTWASSPTYDGANSAGTYLGGIDPNASCYGEAKAFADDVQKRVKEIDSRNWDYTLKAQQNDATYKSNLLQAARDVAVAYENNRATTVTTWSYNIVGWW